MKATEIKRPDIKEDVWVHSVCDMCFSHCPLLIHRVDGVIKKIEGDPNGPFGNRKLCAKGFAGFMSTYDPYRLTKPMKRTNLQKGLSIDPGWQEITWEEALTTITEKLKKIRADDPRKLHMSISSTESMGDFAQSIWGSAFGTPNSRWSGYFCGNYLHSSMYLTNATFHSDFDIENCKYVILQGNQMGFMVGLASNIMAQKMAEARIRGLKVVAVDPVLTNAAGKADEWVPIRPGTDAAFLLALINVLVNDLKLYDVEFIKKKTNGPYLVAPNGHYVREGKKPLVWDTVDKMAKPFDASVKDYALDGKFTVNDVECRPAFHYFKEKAKEYSPEEASTITSVPVETIRRIAREFGEAACIGATRVVDGHEIPYRPVAVNIYRGAGAHNHGVFAALAVQALNLIVGNYYAVGGHRGSNPVGPSGSWSPRMSSDGMIVPHSSQGHGADYYDFEVGAPETLVARELLPISTNRSAMVQHTVEHPEHFKMEYQPEMQIMIRHNQLMTTGAPERTAEVFKRIPFIVYFATHIDEQAVFADILLPEPHFLERKELFTGAGGIDVSASTGLFYWRIRQPVVEPAGESRYWVEVLLDLAERCGFLDEVYLHMNTTYGIKGRHQLERGKKYSLDEIYDRRLKSQFGEDKGLDWFQKNGSYKVKRKVEETYPAAFLPQRFTLYYENVLRAGEEVKAVTDELGIEWDTSDYSATLYWKPCLAFSEKPRDDFYAVNFRVPTHSLSYTVENPWLKEIGEMNSYAFKVLMNAAAAAKKGINDGDTVKVESEAGAVVGTVKVTEGVHPEVIGIAGTFGASADGRPIAKGTGVHFNTLIPVDMKRTDPISGGLDACVRVKVTKVEAKSSK